MPIFDAHLDLAYLAETGRDLHAPPEFSPGRHRPAAVTLPALRDAGVTTVLGTIFTEPSPEPPGAFAYPPGDTDAAYRAGMRQALLYRAWRDAGLVRYLSPRAEALRPAPQPATQPADHQPIALGVLVENADPIPSADELDAWLDLGVVAIGLTWSLDNRYACGNATEDDSGLTPLGRDLVDRMAAERVVPDLSHLSDRSLQQLLERTDDLVVATHSNCRALLDDDMRHLTDETIREIARRGGVVGLNLYSGFLDSKHMRSGRATIDDCVRHVEHVCGLVGSTAHIGLGSDLDGGFDATHLPRGIDRPTDLAKLFEALAGNGWSEDDLDAFTHRNWRRVFQSD